uniref:C2H2-type domain-containing protein n=1 Tax=Clastoptera arizonana TaxID=38151 RepID=A0A1B6C3L7_9HEMI
MSVAIMNCNDVLFERIEDGTTKGAMLTMLAEVASQALLANNDGRNSTSSLSSSGKRKGLKAITVEQALSLSTNHLLKIFSAFDSDEIKRVFSYKCLMLQPECDVTFSSFGSESKARHMIREHLHTHLYSLNPDDVLNIQNKEDLSFKKITSPVSKISKKCKYKLIEEAVEPEPLLQNENIFQVEIQPDTIETTEVINETQTECFESSKSTTIDKLPRQDHNYHRINCVPVAQSIFENNDIKLSEDNCVVNFLEDQFWDDMPDVAKEVVVKTEVEYSEEEEEGDLLSTYKPRIITTKTIKSEDLPVLQDNRTLDTSDALLDPEAMREYMHIERDEHRLHKKPKGKAKFIGQSAAEKEMAVRMIEAMKFKGSGEPLECQICIPSRVFTAPTTLISHYRSHAGIKPYECHLCGSVFTRQHSLNYHLLIHSNKTRFTCEDCGRKFRHPSHFKEHQRRHTGEAPFECSDCITRFKTRNTYKRHLKTRHGKVLTQSGGIIILSDEEFRRVRTSPRSSQTRIVPASNDKENNRRLRGKVANILRRGKVKKDILDLNADEKACNPNKSNWDSENLIFKDFSSPDVDEDCTMEASQALAIVKETIPTTIMLVTTAAFQSNVLNETHKHVALL